jgi:hypothetical protein
MTILNCTLKLSNRIPFPMSEGTFQPTNTLGQWSGNAFNLGRFPYIILTNELTLLSVVISLKDVHTFWSRFLISLERLMLHIEVPHSEVQQELLSMAEVRFTRNTNRRTLGSMTDLVHMVRAIVDQDEDSSLDQINRQLSRVPSLTLQGLYPRDAVHRAFHRLPPKWNER